MEKKNVKTDLIKTTDVGANTIHIFGCYDRGSIDEDYDYYEIAVNGNRLRETFTEYPTDALIREVVGE